MDEIPSRLKWLADRKQLGTYRAAANFYGVEYETYKKAAKGERDLSPANAEKIARRQGVSPGWLMFGDGTPEGELQIRLSGKIGAGQEMIVFETIEGDFVDALVAAPDAQAYEVSGDSMYPLARDRDIIFVGREQKEFARLIGQECIVYLQDGRRFFKVLERGSRAGFFDLHSYNAEPIRDVAVHSAGRFIGLKRR